MHANRNREWTRNKNSAKARRKDRLTADKSAAASLPPSSLVPRTMADKTARQAAEEKTHAKTQREETGIAAKRHKRRKTEISRKAAKEERIFTGRSQRTQRRRFPTDG
jgi:hypothetical protein